MRVIYSKGVLGAAQISVNYIKDDIKARKSLRCYLIDVTASFCIKCLFPTMIVAEIP